MQALCEIIEVAHAEDAIGYPCGGEASGRCCDCGAHVCDAHADACEFCNEMFCSTCLAFHSREYHRKKAASANRENRKSA